MIKTPLSTMIGGAGIWTPGATTIGAFGTKKTFNQLIKSLFANNEQGFAYDPNDLSMMYQDAAGTIPVTGAGQPVGLVKDKSGRNNHAYQSGSSSRPILQRNATTGAYYLAFDGVDDFLQTNNIDFTTTDAVGLFAAVKNISTNPYQNIVELSASASVSNGTFLLRCPQESLRPLYLSRGTIAAQTGILSTTPDLLAGMVLSSQSKISTDTLRLRVNGVLNSISTDQGTGTYSNHPIYIGMRGGTSLPFNGHLYSLIGIGRLATDSETLALEKAIAKNTGVTLSV